MDRLLERGCEVEVFHDRLPRAGATGIVLDPHDGLERIASAGEIARFLQRAIVISTAAGPDGRPRDRPFLEVAGAIAVTSPLLAGRLAAEGSKVELVGIGYDESFLGEPSRARTNDVAVLLPSALGRDRAIAQIAPVLAARSHEVRLDYTRDLIGRSATELDVADRRSLLARTRVVVFAPDELNRPCIDWLQLHDVFANGCCVLTSRTMDLGPLVPSRHLVTAGPTSIAWVLERLLADSAWQREIADAGLSLVKQELSVEYTVEVLLELLASQPAATPRRFIPSTRSPAVVEVDEAAAEMIARIALENAELRRFVPLPVSSVAMESVGYSALVPDVSVVIPLHNYASYIEAAVESALNATGVRVEVIVVDDASTDDSAATVAALIERTPAHAILLHRLSVPGGPGAARNIGFGCARSPFIYTLDADDLLYAQGLERLVRGIESDAHAGFAFGLIERFDESGPCDLIGTQGFDVGLFAFGNFLPASGLTRKRAWEDVGGYCERGVFQLGWEDYDFWLRLIDAGYRAHWIPEIVGRYRRHGESMSSLSDLVAPELDAQIRAEHPAIFERATS